MNPKIKELLWSLWVVVKLSELPSSFLLAGSTIQILIFRTPNNIGALLIKIGFWGPLNYNDNKEPPKWCC